MANLIPNAKQQFFGPNGVPLSGGSVYYYIPNTTTFKATYQDQAQTILNTNPIILDANGECVAWGTGAYRQQVFDVNGNLIWDQVTQDPQAALTGNIADKKYAAGTDFTPGTTTTLTLPTAPGSVANMWVFFDAAFQADDQFSVNGTTLTFNSPIPVGVNEVNVKIGTTIAIGTPSNGTTTDASVATGTKLYNRINDFYDLRDPAYGAKCNGTTDDTAAVQAFINTIGSNPATLIIPGPTLISSTLTFSPNTQLFPLNGGYFAGKVGTEIINVQSPPLTGPVPLFLNCAAQATNGMTCYPEWFGAKADGSTADDVAIQSAINFLKNTGGVVQFDARTYILSTNVNIGTGQAGSTGQNTVLQGKGRHSTILRTTSATTSAIQVLGASGTALQGISIRDMTIDKSVTGTGGVGIALQYTAGFTMRDIQINNYLFGCSYLRATNTIAEKVTVTFSGATNNWHGFDLSGGGTGAGGNASSVFRDCYVDGTNATGTGSIGFYAYGAYVSDLQFLACETAKCAIGYEFDMSASANTGNEDVQLINCRADSISTYGVYVNAAGGSGSNDSMVTVIGGWYNALSTGAEVDLIFITGSQGVTVQGAQLYGVNSPGNTWGVKLVNSQGCKVQGCTVREVKYGVNLNGGRANNVMGNDFYNSSAISATSFANGTGEAYSSISNNTFRGYSTQAALFDATSTSCAMNCNNADPSNITTRFTNSSGGTPSTIGNVGA
jgi:hypothetical protein